MNVTWRDKIRNEILHGNLPRVTDETRERRLRLAGHCVRYGGLEVTHWSCGRQLKIKPG